MTSLYLVLDMQNDLVHADGPNGKSPLGEQVAARNILASTRTAIEKARKAGVRVGFVRVGFSADYHECPAASPVFGAAPKAGLFKLGNWAQKSIPTCPSRMAMSRSSSIASVRSTRRRWRRS